ncbi:MAG: EamA family transporter RarD [Actinomycetes bacterium]
MKNYKVGLLLGIGSYLIWGLFPLYWPLLKPANSIEIVSHRAVWTFVLCIILLLTMGKLRSTFSLLKSRRIALRLAISTVLVSVNWLVYIWGVNHGHVVECALGYYINPLIIIAFGVILLKEKMRKLQWVSVGIATVGVIVLTVDYGRPPWIAIALAASWGSYGLVKKQLGLAALDGLAIETTLSLIPYGGYLLWMGNKGTGQFGHHLGLTALLMFAGVATAVPLLMFNSSTNTLKFTIIGLLQYITPSVQFLIGVLVRHEAMTTGRWVGFLVVWVALITLGYDLVKSGSSSNNSFAEFD